MTGRALVLAASLLALIQMSFVGAIPLFRGNSFINAAGGRSSAAAFSSHALAGANVDLSDSGPAGIALAARQGLFDYSVGVAFMFLSQKLQGQSVPDVSKVFSIPVVGSFELQLTNILVTDFACPASRANLAILGDGFFHLLASDISANLTFQWRWTKAGLSGSGEGELRLGGGTIDWVYDVRKDEQLQKPQLQVVTANSNFDSVDLKIHSYSADWLYQAVLTLFNEAVKRQVQRSVASALDEDVPARINAVLGSLPTRLDVRGLPFSASFEYSIYTAAFVLVQGFGEVEVVEATQQPEGEAGLLQAERKLQRAAAAAEPAAAEPAAGVSAMTVCPFETSVLPVSGEAIGAERSMVSIYVHEATAQCLLWGLYRSGKLALSLRDGTVPGLTVTTDILALLVPELPTKYPHQKMIINVEALDAPSLSFGADNGGVTLSAYYRLALVVTNDSLGNPEVVRLRANLSLNGAFDWDVSSIGAVQARHVVEASELDVPAEQWDNTVTWLLQSYGGLLSLRQVVETVVRTPITSLVSLGRTSATTWDRWYALSADVELRLPPPPAQLSASPVV